MTRVAPRLTLLVAGSLAATLAAQSPPMQDVLWVAQDFRSRDLVAVDRAGRTTAVPLPSRVFQVHRAPDGTLWTIGEPGAIERRGRDGTLIRSWSPGGRPVALAIDAAGDAWIAVDGLPGASLQRFRADGTVVSSRPLLAPPIDVEVASDGSIWVLQSNLPGDLVSIFRPSGIAGSFSLPHALGRCRDLETTPWATADVAGEGGIVEVSALGVVLRTLATGPSGQIARHASGDLFVIAGTSHPSAQRVRPDGRIDTLSEYAHSLSLDAIGGLWIDESELHRIDVARARSDLAVNLHVEPLDDAAGYHRALVVARGADDDHDGYANGLELQLGTNPYDRQSSPAAVLEVERITSRGFEPIVFGLRGLASQGAVLLAAQDLPVPMRIPGILGRLRLDPTTIADLLVAPGIPRSLSLAVPADPSLDGLRLFAQALFGPNSPSWSNEVAVQVSTASSVVTETFDSDGLLAAPISSGSWGGGVARPGLIGGRGIHGVFDHSIGQDLGGGVWLWSTDSMTIPARLTLDGRDLTVTNGRFEFTHFELPAGVTVRFRGSHPAVIRVSGVCSIDGELDLSAPTVPGEHNGRNATIVGGVVQPGPGQSGGEPGAGGGRGGDGAWTCDGSGNPNQPAFNSFAGYDGEPVQLLPSHPYGSAALGTQGRGSPLFPPHGDRWALVFRGFGGTYAVETAAGGGGGGHRSAGAPGVCVEAGAIQGSPPYPNTSPAERGPDGPGGSALSLPAVGFGSALDWFLAGGAGGGGGGSNPTFALHASAVVPFASGGGGAGGGGAIALRVGRSLSVTAGGRIAVRGGSTEPTGSAFTHSLRGLPAPGGGGAGGTVLLQVGEGGAAVQQLGTIDARGGSGGVTAFRAFFAVDTRGGDGGDGRIRLELADPNPSVGLLGATQPPATMADVATLGDRDAVTTQFSLDYRLPDPLLEQPAYYELDVRIDGATVTFTDNPARFSPADQPGLPVRIRFQARHRDGSLGPWRDLVSDHVPGTASLAADHARAFRHQLLFDRSVASSIEVEELRIVMQ